MLTFNKTLIAVSVALVGMNASASTPTELSHEASALQFAKRIAAQSKLAKKSVAQRNTANVIDVLVQVQPTYLQSLNEYDAHIRIQEVYDYTNQILENNNLDLSVQVVDIVPMVSVSSTVALQAPDADIYPELFRTGPDAPFEYASSRHFNVTFNTGNPENNLYLQWGPDMVGYFREYRSNDGSKRGEGQTLWGSHTLLDDYTDPNTNFILAHELGHNLGAHHEIEDTVNGDFSYGQAYQCEEKTLMFSSSSRSAFDGLPVFSSGTETSQNGKQCGVEGEADNLRVVQEVGPEAALWGEGHSRVGEVNLGQPTYTVSENNDLTVTVNRTGDLSQTASVKVFARNDTATWPEDFTTVFAVAEFAAGESTAQVSIDIAEDLVVEEQQSFNLVLLYPFQTNVGDAATATVTINDVEQDANAAGTFSIEAVHTAVESETAQVLITRTGGSTGDVVLDIDGVDLQARFADATLNDPKNAAYDVDYVGLSPLTDRKVFFKDGQTSATFDLIINDDAHIEPNERLTVAISGPDYIAIDNAMSEIVITDNDSTNAGIVSIGNTAASVTEGGQVTLTVSRVDGFLGEVSGEITVTFSNGSTSQAVDFVIADGEAETQVAITVPDNATDESDYSLTATLSISSGSATIGTSEASVSVVDNDTATPAPAPTTGEESGGGGSFGFFLAILGMLGLARRRA